MYFIRAIGKYGQSPARRKSISLFSDRLLVDGADEIAADEMAVSNRNQTRTSRTITGYNVSMGEQDILSKQIFKNLVRDFATYLFGLAVSEVE
ncbi:MAG: hypothetical protein ACRESZ_12995, partial [Methylococcales bacterium]